MATIRQKLAAKMQKLKIVAVGAMRGSVYQPCFDQYMGRMTTEVVLKEVFAHSRGKQNQNENELILQAISKDPFVIALDSSGRAVT